MAHLPHHPEGHGEDRGAGVSPHRVGEHRAAALHVDAHAEQGVDQAEAVGPGLLAGAGYRHDVGDVGGEFHVEGFGGHGFHRLHHRGDAFRVGAEAHAAAMHIGAAHVELDDLHLLLGVDAAAGLGVFLHRETADVGHDRAPVDGSHLRQFLGDHAVDSGILEADGVEDAGGAFRHARQFVAEAGMKRGPLEGDGAEDVDVIPVGHLVAIAEAAAGGDHRVFESEVAEAGGQVDAVHFHISSSLSKTGPSLQILLEPRVVSSEQHMQAPKPQPMRASRLSWPGMARREQSARSIGVGPQA